MSPPDDAHIEPASTWPWIQFRGPKSFQWRRARLPIASLPAVLDGLRILHVSDMHFVDRWTRAHDLLLQRIAENPPDLILFTGDFVENQGDHRGAIDSVLRFVQGLRARLGTFAIVGNHDRDLIAPYLAGQPITMLDGSRHLLLDESDTGIELIGLPGINRNDLTQEFIRDLPPKSDRQLRIALGHYPDQFRAIRSWNTDLYLAGHTHGGQICLPGGIPLITHDALPRKFARGIHKVGNTWMITTRGFGYTAIPLRTFCPTEVMELTIARPHV